MPSRGAGSMLVHIGFHKTGTTWLQTGLFRSAPFHVGWDSMTIADTVILTHSLDWSTDAIRAELAARADRSSADGLVVMSWERLSGSPHAGGYDSGLIADRLHSLFPEARVLIGVREQRSMIEALYRQYVRDGGIATLYGYLRPRNPAELPQFRFDHLAYDRLVSHYLDRFGPDQVLVLPYEALVEDQDAFVTRICRFCEVEVPTSSIEPATYPGLRPLTTALKRRANKVFVRNSLSPGARYYVKDHETRFDHIDRWLPRVADAGIRSRWQEAIAEATTGRYEQSNLRLAALIEQDLRRYGYALPGHD